MVAIVVLAGSRHLAKHTALKRVWEMICGLPLPCLQLPAKISIKHSIFSHQFLLSASDSDWLVWPDGKYPIALLNNTKYMCPSSPLRVIILSGMYVSCMGSHTGTFYGPSQKKAEKN